MSSDTYVSCIVADTKKAQEHMGPPRTVASVKGVYNRMQVLYKYIQSMEDHTGGGNGDPSNDKFSPKVCEVFKAMGYYDIFDAV